MRASGLGRVTSNWRRASREISHVPASRRWPNEVFSLTMLQSPLLVFCHMPSYERCCAQNTKLSPFRRVPVLLPVRAGDVDPPLRCSRRRESSLRGLTGSEPVERRFIQLQRQCGHVLRELLKRRATDHGKRKVSANTAVTRADSPVNSATSRNNPAPACDARPSPSADTFTPQTAALRVT